MLLLFFALPPHRFFLFYFIFYFLFLSCRLILRSAPSWPSSSGEAEWSRGERRGERASLRFDCVSALSMQTMPLGSNKDDLPCFGLVSWLCFFFLFCLLLCINLHTKLSKKGKNKSKINKNEGKKKIWLSCCSFYDRHCVRRRRIMMMEMMMMMMTLPWPSHPHPHLSFSLSLALSMTCPSRRPALSSLSLFLGTVVCVRIRDAAVYGYSLKLMLLNSL